MFTDTLARWLEGVKDATDRWIMRKTLEPLFDRYSSTSLNTAGLVISVGGSTLAKTGAVDFYAIANGVLVKVAAGTNMPALTGINAAGNQFVVAAFFIDSGGTVTALGGTPGATLAATLFPQFPKQKALIGFLLITNGASAFTGGTTPLDTATTVYFSPAGTEFDPWVLVGAPTP